MKASASCHNKPLSYALGGELVQVASLASSPPHLQRDLFGVALQPLPAPQRDPEGLDTGDQARSEPRRGKKRNNRFALDYAHADKQLELMQYCGQQVLRFVHKRIICNASIFIPTSCDVRTCRNCGKSRTRRELGRYLDGIRSFAHPALLTLTVPNVMTLEELPAALENLTKGFERLRRHKLWPKGAKGVWSLEVTWSEAEGYHPHVHAVCDLPWVDFKWLASAWEKLTGAKHQPDVKRPSSEAQKARLPFEGIKYISKAWELPPDVLRGLLAILGRRKMLNAFGKLRAKKEDKIDSGACCPGCQVPLKQCGMNMERSTLLKSEAESIQTWLKTEGHPVYTDWFYHDRDGDPDLPPECRAPVPRTYWEDGF